MRFLFKKGYLFILVSMLYLFCKKQLDAAIPQPRATINYNNIITSECHFILAHQLNDGAFTMSANQDSAGYKIVPYFNNIAARALLENPVPENLAAVRRWMIWYMTHLNADGSV